MAQTYARVAASFWTGDTGRALRKLGAESQLVALYLITCPSANSLGIYYLPLALLAHETGRPFDDAAAAMANLEDAGFVVWDREAEMVWIPEMARHQIGETLSVNDKRYKWVVAELKRIKGPLVARFNEHYRDVYNLPDGEKPSKKPLRSPLKGPTGHSGSPFDAQSHNQYQDPDPLPGRVVAKDLTGSARDDASEQPPPPHSEVFEVRATPRADREPTRPENPIPDRPARQPGVAPEPRRDVFTTLRPPEWSPSDEGVAYARELGLSERAIDETITELRNKWGTRAFTVDYWDRKWVSFVEQRAKGPTRRRSGATDVYVPTAAEEAAAVALIRRPRDAPVHAQVVGISKGNRR